MRRPERKTQVEQVGSVGIYIERVQRDQECSDEREHRLDPFHRDAAVRLGHRVRSIPLVPRSDLIKHRSPAMLISDLACVSAEIRLPDVANDREGNGRTTSGRRYPVLSELSGRLRSSMIGEQRNG